MERESAETLPMLREELLGTYRHPFWRFLPFALKAWRVKRLAAQGAVTLGVLAVLTGSSATHPAEGWRVLAVAGALMALGLGTVVAAQTAVAVRRHTESWRRRDRSALAQVREQRPHRGEIDRDVAHSEYAVEVGDDGFLRTWCFTPLTAFVPDVRVDLTGTPRYAAEEVHRRAFDALDVTRAAEALAEEQEQAAVWEAQAAEEGRAALIAAEEARLLEAETRSTAAALRGATGVRRR